MRVRHTLNDIPSPDPVSVKLNQPCLLSLKTDNCTSNVFTMCACKYVYLCVKHCFEKGQQLY